MSAKGGNLLVEHIEKIVLGLIGALCLVLIVLYVIMGVTVEYDGRKHSPAEVDKYVVKQSEIIAANLLGQPKPGQEYKSELNDYMQKFDKAVSVNSKLWPVIPYAVGDDDWDGRQYGLPDPPQISKAGVNFIRAAAYVPTEIVSSNTSYSSIDAEPNDIDLVTISAQLDTSTLYESFNNNFMGPTVKPEWRDPCLSGPIFAAVQLQRSTQLPNGSWGKWNGVSRLKIDNQKQLLEIIDRVPSLPRGGMKVRLLQYNNLDVKMNVLQPMPYDIASAEEDWMPPSLYGDFKKRLAEQEADIRREEMQERQSERDEKRESRTKSRERRTKSTGSGNIGGAMSDMMGGGGMMSPTGGGGSSKPRRSDRDRTKRTNDSGRSEDRERRRKEREEEKSLDAIYDQLDEILIDDETELDKLEEPLQFWAHDENIQPGETYKYRIRLGVFNPIADSPKLNSAFIDYKDTVILWSEFMETDPVDIPDRLYFFAKDIREAANTVNVEVFKYAMGYWYRKEFIVECGEVIGKVDEPELNKPKKSDKDDRSSDKDEPEHIPELVDFRTNVMMVDAVPVEDWAGDQNIKHRSYFSMYYSYDGSLIEEMPIRQRFWASDIQRLYNDVRDKARMQRKPFRDRGQGIKGRGPSSVPGDMMDPGSMQGIMQQMMQGM